MASSHRIKESSKRLGFALDWSDSTSLSSSPFRLDRTKLFFFQSFLYIFYLWGANWQERCVADERLAGFVLAPARHRPHIIRSNETPMKTMSIIVQIKEYRIIIIIEREKNFEWIAKGFFTLKGFLAEEHFLNWDKIIAFRSRNRGGGQMTYECLVTE